MAENVDTGPATLFNTFKADLLGRVTAFCNFLILVSGSILSLTIGAFLNTQSPRIGSDGLFAIRNGWILLTASLVLALTVTALVVAAQASVSRKWLAELEKQAPMNQRVFKNPEWVKHAITITMTLAFLTCVLGTCAISYGAIQLLNLPAS
jgi:hypothetical protein